MKFMLAIFSFIALPTLAHAAVIEGHCSILQQPSASQPAKLLAYKKISLSAGETQTIYVDGDIKYQVILIGTHNLETIITYGAGRFLASAMASYDDKTLNSGGSISVGVELPGFPTFGCGKD